MRRVALDVPMMLARQDRHHCAGTLVARTIMLALLQGCLGAAWYGKEGALIPLVDMTLVAGLSNTDLGWLGPECQAKAVVSLRGAGGVHECLDGWWLFVGGWKEMGL